MSFKYDLAKFIAFRDEEACARVRAIKKEDITKHSNPDFKIDLGLQKLEEAIERVVQSGVAEIPGMEAFVLYDTYGFPFELTQEIAANHNLTVDVQGFDDAMEEQRRKAREGSDISDSVFGGSLGALAEIEKAHPATEFVGYSEFTTTAKVIGILKDGELIDKAGVGEKVDIVLDKTPFYPDGGGQVADIGFITCNGTEVQVTGTARVGSMIVHAGEIKAGELLSGSEIKAAIDSARRMSTMRNHTATHLLQKSLRMLLGDHVVQSGSFVEPTRLRFDFTHPMAVTPDELLTVEKTVNDAILRDMEVQTAERTLEQAKEDGAMALFSEKYSGVVRVITVGDFSMELCGGTHIGRTSQIGLFKITSESSVGAGLRRIEAVTGYSALEYVSERDALLKSAAETLSTNVDELPQSVEKIVDRLKCAEKQIEDLKRQAAGGQADELASVAQLFGGISVVAHRVDLGDAESMSALADTLANKLKSAVIVLAGPSDGKVIFVSKVTPDLVKRGFHAGNLIREVAKVAGGGGGGRPDFAQAGGKDAGKLDAALAKAKEIIEQQVKS